MCRNLGLRFSFFHEFGEQLVLTLMKDIMIRQQKEARDESSPFQIAPCYSFLARIRIVVRLRGMQIFF